MVITSTLKSNHHRKEDTLNHQFIHLRKKKNAPTDVYRQKQKNAASAALKQESLPSAVAILRESLPFEYITCGNQMRSNIEYELQAAEKQREIGYKPVHDSASFK
ncbi:unnamed protein product [Rotaria socialis]|uniref:Uncharacterized protein n=1 Tax=Rotaria socialis TaxID=392032 RepID=A0A821I7Y7_9BILA|nr:unnamed protein product [Rotaria socialis]